MEEFEKKELLELAYASIKTYFQGRKPDVSSAKKYGWKSGVFVSLYDKRGALRGCVGFASPVHPLYIAVIEAARSAAFADSRFSPLKKEELDDIKVEISILTNPTLIKIKYINDYLKNIKIGVDGLIVEKDDNSGLLLPQVALENNFNVQSFLNCACQKAGLSFNAWKDTETKIYKFQAEVFRG